MKIENCGDCPLLNNDVERGSECNHPNANEDTNLEISNLYRPIDGVWEIWGFPDSCPLKNNPITIEV